MIGTNKTSVKGHKSFSLHELLSVSVIKGSVGNFYKDYFLTYLLKLSHILTVIHKTDNPGPLAPPSSAYAIYKNPPRLNEKNQSEPEVSNAVSITARAHAAA